MLKLDGEYSNVNYLIKVIPNLNVLTELTISYCENINDDFLNMIILISGN